MYTFQSVLIVPKLQLFLKYTIWIFIGIVASTYFPQICQCKQDLAGTEGVWQGKKLVVVHSYFLPLRPIFPFRDLGCSKGTNYFLSNTKPFAILYTQTTKWELHVTIIFSYANDNALQVYSYTWTTLLFMSFTTLVHAHTQSYSQRLCSQRNLKT
jgi:hypothetical protein